MSVCAGISTYLYRHAWVLVIAHHSTIRLCEAKSKNERVTFFYALECATLYITKSLSSPRKLFFKKLFPPH